MVLFDRSGRFSRWDRNVPFHWTLYPACKNNNQVRGGLGRVCATGMYRSIEHVKFPKFQTRIFVEWKAPVLSQWSVKSGGSVVDAEEIMTAVTGNEKGEAKPFLPKPIAYLHIFQL